MYLEQIQYSIVPYKAYAVLGGAVQESSLFVTVLYVFLNPIQRVSRVYSKVSLQFLHFLTEDPDSQQQSIQSQRHVSRQ